MKPLKPTVHYTTLSSFTWFIPDVCNHFTAPHNDDAHTFMFVFFKMPDCALKLKGIYLLHYRSLLTGTRPHLCPF